MATPGEPISPPPLDAIFRAVVQQSTIIVVVMDLERVRYASPSSVDLLGHELVGSSLEELSTHIHPDDLPGAVARFGEIWAQPGGHDVMELRVRDSGSWRLIEVAATNLMHDAAIGGVVMSGRDITDRRATEIALIENERQVHALEIQMHEERAAEHHRRAQHLDVIGLLAAGAAHDFGNLLGVISNCNQLARRQVAADDPVQEELATIERAVERASELTHQLLQFGGPVTSQVARFDLHALAAEAIALLDRSSDAMVQFVHTADEPRLEVRGDRRRIERAILNLLINACAAVPEGGTVTVTTDAVEIDLVRAAAVGIDAGRYARLTVRDEGAGMTPEVLARAFEPFFTTSADHRGTGLGLAAAKDAVERADGAIQLDSAIGRGTTATMLLPTAG